MTVIWNLRNISQDAKIPQDISLDEYYRIAKRCICTFAKGLSYRMLRDDDAISYVAETLMFAATKWEDGKGRTFKSYLNQHAIWAIIKWIKLVKKDGQTKSLDYVHSTNNLYDVLPNENDSPLDIIESKEENQILEVALSTLTNRQRECVVDVYLNGAKQSDTARKLGISRQAVSSSIKEGLHNLKEILST